MNIVDKVHISTDSNKVVTAVMDCCIKVLYVQNNDGITNFKYTKKFKLFGKCRTETTQVEINYFFKLISISLLKLNSGFTHIFSINTLNICSG